MLYDCVYVDDLPFGASTKESLRSTRNEVIQILNSRKLPLKKWNANHPDLLSDLPPRDVHPGSKDNSSLVKLLGVS